MAEIISPEAQSVIDRLRRMDLAKPRQDKATIELAISTHLGTLDIPKRPFVWANNAQSGYAFVSQRVAPTWEARDTVWFESWKAAWLAACDAARNTNFPLGIWDMWDRSVWIVAQAAAFRSANRDAARDSRYVLATDRDAAQNARKSEHDAAFDAAMAFGAINGHAGCSHSATAKLVSIWLPMLTAFEAGLFLYWITSDEVVCVLRPSLSIENGRLHRKDGPAIWWPSGEAYYFWRGVEVPEWLILEPGRITVRDIRLEPNQEIRRCMAEIYGVARYLKDSNGRLVHVDEFGRLWEVKVANEVWRIVEVEDGTPGPDGTRRTYTLDITDAAEILGWPIETARAAVAATYGLRPEEYCPEIRT